jgi:4-amino-4-deoxy-L-arabinose transferase-like glycosyltransferase
MLRTLERDSARNYALLGLLLGLAYLGKEPGILLVPALWVYLLVTPQHRRVLTRPSWYLAHAVFLLVIAPDIVWNLSQLTESYLYRGVAFLQEPWQLSAKPLSLYLGELFYTFIGPHTLGADYEQGNLYPCHWVAGVLYLVAIASALDRRDFVPVRLMLVTFLFVFVTFLVLPGGERFDPFWWASISLIPAVVCAGGLLDRMVATAKTGRGRRLLGVAALVLLGYLGGRCLADAWRSGPYAPRTTVDDLIDRTLDEGHRFLEEGRVFDSRRQFIYVLNLGGPNAEAYYGLADVAQRRGYPENAAALRVKGRHVDSERREECSP